MHYEKMNQDDKMEKKIIIEKPEDIEKKSFMIIQEELDRMGKKLPPKEAPVTMRLIHTSADFDYADTLKFSKTIALSDKTIYEDMEHNYSGTAGDFDSVNSQYSHAVDVALDLLKSGADIVTDTNMAKAGISKAALETLGIRVHCFMVDEDVAGIAKERGITRAEVSMEKAAKLEGPLIFAIGNAPTALIKLREMYDKGIYTPAFIIGVPVGFVNVVYAKELIMETDIPYIVNSGRKGGSNIAAATVNALMYMLTR